MNSLTKKQMELFRQFHRIKLYSPDNRTMQARYEDIVRLVARHFPVKTEADKEQFKQILVLLRELKDREMTAEQLKQGLSETFSKKSNKGDIETSQKSTLKNLSSIESQKILKSTQDAQLNQHEFQKINELDDTNKLDKKEDKEDKEEDKSEYFDFSSIGIDLKSLDSRYGQL